MRSTTTSSSSSSMLSPAVSTTIIDSNHKQQHQSKYSSPPVSPSRGNRKVSFSSSSTTSTTMRAPAPVSRITTKTLSSLFPSSSSSYYYSPRTQQDQLDANQLQQEIYALERQLVQEKLRGEWATRRLIALESVEVSKNPRSHLLALTMSSKISHSNNNNNNDKENSNNDHNNHYSSSLSSRFISEKNPSIVKSPARSHIVSELIARNAASYPTQTEFQRDLSDRIEKSEQENRRIRDQIAQLEAIQQATERSHREKLQNLRQRRDQIRDRKFTTESQLRVTQGALQDDDMLADSQYRRYAVRLEKSRQDSQIRHNSGLKVQTERNDLRCSMIQKETDDVAASLRKLIQEKTVQLQEASANEKNSLDVAQKLGVRVEEIEHADSEIQTLSKRKDLLEIEQRQLCNESQMLMEEIRKSRYWILELDGKLSSTGKSDLQKVQAQQSKNDALMKSVRTLQERIAIASKRGRGRDISRFSGDSVGFAAHEQQQQQKLVRSGRDLVLLDNKLEELNKLNYTNRLDIHNREQELAKLSDNYLHLEERLREVKLESELLQTKVTQYRHEAALGNARADLQFITNSGLTGANAAGSLFLLNSLRK